MNREDIVALAKVRLEEILTFFGINVSVAAEDDGDRIELKVPSSDMTGRLIGRRGENLRSINYLLSAMIQQQTGERARISVDVAGYRAARAHTITEHALGVAKRVVESGRSETLRPMSPAERRVVHTALAELDDIETESVGEDPRRRVVIKPKGRDGGEPADALDDESE